jgi:hypothetical protein
MKPLLGRTVFRRAVHGALGLAAARDIAVAVVGGGATVATIGLAPILVTVGAVVGSVYVVDKLMYGDDREDNKSKEP